MGAVAIAAYVVLPLGVETVMYIVISMSTALALAVAAHRTRGLDRLVWTLLAVGQLCYAAGDVAFTVTYQLQGEVPAFSYIDVLYLANYPIVGTGLIILAHRRQATRGWDTVLDMLTAGVAAALAIWMLLLPLFTKPSGSSGEAEVYLAYPVADLIMIVLIARLAIGSGSRVWSLWLLLLGDILIIFADLIYAAVSVRSSFEGGTYVDLLWLYGYLAIALAALHPSARTIGRPDPSTRKSLLYRRIAFVSAAGLVPPILFAINTAIGQQPSLVVFAVGSAVLYLLILSRVFLSVRREDEELRRARLPWFHEELRS